jgi:hypothetical protein
MNIYPNSNCALFCTWLLNNSLIRLTVPRKIQVQTVYTAASTGSYVTQLYYEEFIQYTNRFYIEYQQYILLQPALPMPGTLDALTIAWLAQVTSPAQQTIYSVDAFFKQLRADGNLAIDYLFLFAQDQQANARISLFNPTLYNVTENGALIWNVNLGYTGDASTAYLQTNYTDSTDGYNVTLNSNSFGVYLRKALAQGNKVNMGANDTINQSLIATAFTSDGKIYASAQASEDVYADYTTQGLFCVQRTTSSNVNLIANGAILNSSSDSSIGLVTIADGIIGWNVLGTPTELDDNQYSLAYKGSGSLNMVTFNSAVNLLMTNIGAHY